jgi:hypothetical protein
MYNSSDVVTCSADEVHPSMIFGQAVIDVQMFAGGIIKEFAIRTPTTSSHHSFKPPYDWDELSAKEQSTNTYCTDYLHEMMWDDGHIEYRHMNKVLMASIPENTVIYCKGSEKCNILSRILKTKVHNLEELGAPKFDTLYKYVKDSMSDEGAFGSKVVFQKAKCKYHDTGPAMCALHKVILFYDWFVNNKDELLKGPPFNTPF